MVKNPDFKKLANEETKSMQPGGATLTTRPKRKVSREVSEEDSCAVCSVGYNVF